MRTTDAVSSTKLANRQEEDSRSIYAGSGSVEKSGAAQSSSLKGPKSLGSPGKRDSANAKHKKVHAYDADSRRKDGWRNKIAAVSAPWLLPIVFLAIWQWASLSEVVSAQLLPTPTKVLHTLWELTINGTLGYHIGVSLQRALIGFVIGGGIGFLLGVLSGRYLGFYRLFDTSIQMLRNIPHLALVPLVIIWLGIDEGAKIFLVSLGVMFPIYVNTYHGIRSVDPGVVEMAKVYGLRSGSLFRHIILPGALPSIFVGLRYALGVMWLTLIVAETIATDAGVGYLALNAREFMQTDIIILSILLYAAFGKGADVFAKLLERKALRWTEHRV